MARRGESVIFECFGSEALLFGPDTRPVRVARTSQDRDSGTHWHGRCAPMSSARCSYRIGGSARAGTVRRAALPAPRRPRSGTWRSAGNRQPHQLF